MFYNLNFWWPKSLKWAARALLLDLTHGQLMKSWKSNGGWNVVVKAASPLGKLKLRTASSYSVFVKRLAWRWHKVPWFILPLSHIPISVTNHSLVHVGPGDAWESDRMHDSVLLLPVVLHPLKVGVIQASCSLNGQRLSLGFLNFDHKAHFVSRDGVESVPCWPYLRRDWL